MTDDDGKRVKNLREFVEEKNIKLVKAIPSPQGNGGKNGGDSGGDKPFRSPNGLRMPHSAIPTGQGKLLVFLRNFFRSLLEKESSGSMRKPSILTEQEIPPMMESLESELTQSPASLIGFLFGGGRIVK